MEGHLLVRQLSTDAAEDPAHRLASLFDTHHDRLYRLARRLASGKDDALDLVQETFLRAARSPDRIPSGSTSDQEAWLVRILINIRRDQWRKASIRIRHDGAAVIAKTQNPEATLINTATVWQALDRLPPRRRAILVMVELEGMLIPAVAGLLGINSITVR